MPNSAQPYIEDPDDEFDYETDWKEFMDGVSQPGGGGHASVSEQERVLVGLIPFNKVRSARRYFLGFSYCDEGPPYALHREPPAVHPTDPSLRAYTFSDVGFVPQSNQDNEDGEPYIASPFQGAFGEQLYYAGYQRAVVTVRYKSFGRMRFLPDSDIGNYQDEWKRWVRFGATQSLEQLQADGSPNLKYAESGESADEPEAGVTAFPVPIATPVAKDKILITWYSVPHDYISNDPVILNPIKIRSCLGMVNSDMFLGYYPGTLAMLDSPTYTEVLFPVQSDDPTDYPLTGWDIQIVLSLFDPPKGVEDSEYRGHNLLPWRPNGLWYMCTRTGDPDGPAILPSTPFLTMFQHQAE